MLMNAGT